MKREEVYHLDLRSIVKKPDMSGGSGGCLMTAGRDTRGEGDQGRGEEVLH